MNKSRTRAIIVIPLLVMLTLTLIVGVSSYQLTRHWENAAREATGSLSEALLLNTYQWTFRQIRDERERSPEKAETMWQDLKGQLALVSRSQPVTSRFSRLYRFVLDDANIDRVDTILSGDDLTVNSQQLMRQLRTFEEQSRQVTVLITVSMVVLGILLTFVTARELEKMFQALERSRDLNINVQEDERRRIAQELHDAVAQELIDLKRDYSPAKVDHLVETIRRICHNLKPQLIEDLGFPAALEFLSDELGRNLDHTVSISLEEDELKRLPKSYEMPLFRVVQELFNNIRRHAEASQASLTIVYHPDESPVLRMYVTDNGRGFDLKNIRRGLGMTGIEERVQRMGGRLKITSEPGKGSQFQVLIPIEKLSEKA